VLASRSDHNLHPSSEEYVREALTMTYTIIVFEYDNIRGFKMGFKLRHALKYRTLIRERGPQWEVWIRPEKSQKKNGKSVG
jgi:hypothetical protein